MKKHCGSVVYSPSDLIRYLASPFSSWLDRSRINSRAKCLAVMVGDPRIAKTPAGSIDEMTLLNLLCKLSE
jgi:hypothetical protein